uniref:Uncharacterized protein n=1 Tax=Tanacetum cinerariifolium TaxID=118510 RepID=A0A699GNJ9_TANCI|nr:hypothetical protein [Tanacetum cinerariifolium]
MMVLYCYKSVAKDREFTIRVNKLRGEMIVACEDKVSFVEELETLSDVIATVKTVVFLKETMDKDYGRMLLLHDLEKQAEEMVLEKEMFVQKLGRNCGALRDAVDGWDWVAMMVLYCRSSIAEDRNFLRRMNQLLQEIVVAYDDKLDFIRELEVVPGVDAAAKTTEFLNKNLWKDDKKLQKLCNMEIDATMRADQKERFIKKL